MEQTEHDCLGRTSVAKGLTVGPATCVDGVVSARGIAGAVLVVDMTSPKMVADVVRAAAVVTASGDEFCHAAILARELDKPCIVGAGRIVLTIPESTSIIVCGRDGQIYLAATATDTAT